jgi:hypothetical protein
MERNNLVIVGAMRSGTTYVGKVLEESNEYTYFHEPFKNKHGIEGINHWFPFSLSNNYDQKVDDFFLGRAKFRIKRHKGNKFWEYYLKKLLGNRDQIRYRNFFRDKTPSKNLLLKDPLASFLSNYIFNKGYANVIVMIRHPMSFYYSKKQKGWDFDFTNFLNQKELIDLYFKDELKEMQRARSLTYEYRIGLLWRCVYKVLTTFSNEHKNKKGWIVVRHEDILQSPAEIFQSLCNQLQIRFTEKMRVFIEETSSNDNKILASENKLHDFMRNSGALKDYWKQRVDNREHVKIIREMTADIADLYFEKDSWQS